jgi:ubiquinone biosynthesis protein
LTPRLSSVWRLAMLFVRESRATASGRTEPIHRVIRSFAAGVRAHGATSLSQRVPLLQNLSGVLGMASGLLTQHPALSETAVRVALAELDTLKTPIEGAALRQALQTALPPGRAATLIDVEDEPERCGIAEQTHRASVQLEAGGSSFSARITLIRADTRRELAQDLEVAGSAARLAERFSREVRAQNVSALIARLGEAVSAMLDLRQRAADQSFLRYRLREVNNDARVVVPEVLWDFCSDTALVTRAVRSVPLSDAAALRAHGIDPVDLIATWIEAFFEITLGEGVYHAGLEAAGAAVSIEADTFGRLVLDGDSPLTNAVSSSPGRMRFCAAITRRRPANTCARACHMGTKRSARCVWRQRTDGKQSVLPAMHIVIAPSPICLRRSARDRWNTLSAMPIPALHRGPRCWRVRRRASRKWRGGLRRTSMSGRSPGA